MTFAYVVLFIELVLFVSDNYSNKHVLLFCLCTFSIGWAKAVMHGATAGTRAESACILPVTVQTVREAGTGLDCYCELVRSG